MAATKGTVIVTGANGRLGAAVVERILQSPGLAADHVGVYTVRNEETATNLKAALASVPAIHQHETVELHLDSIKDVKSFCTAINSRVAGGQLPPIRTLILNAGYLDSLGLSLTGDGFDTTWQVNFLANFMLTLLLLESMDKERGRIVFISSWTHDIDDLRNETGGFLVYKGWNDMTPPTHLQATGEWCAPDSEPGPFPGHRRYGASKLSGMMHMYELAKRLSQDPGLFMIRLVAIDPGAMPTDLARRSTRKMKRNIMIAAYFAAIVTWFSPNGVLRTPAKSASDVVRSCFEIEAPATPQVLYLNGSEEIQPARALQDRSKRKALWGYALGTALLGQQDTALRDWS